MHKVNGFFFQTANSPIVLMIQPKAILVQELKTGNGKVKALDVVAFRHTAANGKDSKTSLLMLCEDGSLRVHNAQAEKTSSWIPAGFTMSMTAFPKGPRKKKFARSVSKQSGLCILNALLRAQNS